MILDTCALLWLASGDRKLSRAALRNEERVRNGSVPHIQTLLLRPAVTSVGGAGFCSSVVQAFSGGPAARFQTLVAL